MMTNAQHASALAIFPGYLFTRCMGCVAYVGHPPHKMVVRADSLCAGCAAPPRRMGALARALRRIAQRIGVRVTARVVFYGGV